MGKKWIEVVLGPGRVVRYSGNECVPADGVVFQLEEVLVRGQKRLSCGKKCKDGDCLVLMRLVSGLTLYLEEVKNLMKKVVATANSK
jgi:hypothetical protein